MAQMSLHIGAEPFLLSYTRYGSRGSSRPKIDFKPHWIYVHCREKTFLLGFANNKGADQPAHRHSLISTFVIRLLESIISRFATSKI